MWQSHIKAAVQRQPQIRTMLEWQLMQLAILPPENLMMHFLTIFWQSFSQFLTNYRQESRNFWYFSSSTLISAILFIFRPKWICPSVRTNHTSAHTYHVTFGFVAFGRRVRWLRFPGQCDGIFSSMHKQQYHVTASAGRIFEISNRIVTVLQYSIQFETSAIIRNFQIITVTDFLLIQQNDADFWP